VPEPECDDTSVVINYDTPESDYFLSMTVLDKSHGSCGNFDLNDLRKMLKGSNKMWRSTCKKTAPHTLNIEPTVDCRGEDWMVQYVTFKIKNVRKVEVFVDDQKVYTVSCNVSIFAIITYFKTKALFWFLTDKTFSNALSQQRNTLQNWIYCGGKRKVWLIGQKIF